MQIDQENIYTSPNKASEEPPSPRQNRYWFKRIGTKAFPITWEGWAVFIGDGIFFFLGIAILRHAEHNLLLTIIGWIIPFLSICHYAKTISTHQQ